MTYSPEPPPGGYPPQPPQGYAPPPHQQYGAPPPGYPPPYGYPRKSRAPMWIGIGVGVVVILGLAIHFVMVDNAWLHPEPASRAPLTAAQKKGYAYVPPNQREAPASSRGLVGRWCVGSQYSQFGADGSFTDSGSRPGTWREVAPGQIHLTLNGTTEVLAVNYRISGQDLSMTTHTGRVSQYTRC